MAGNGGGLAGDRLRPPCGRSSLAISRPLLARAGAGDDRSWQAYPTVFHSGQKAYAFNQRSMPAAAAMPVAKQAWSR